MTQASLVRSFCTPVASMGLLFGAIVTTGCGGGGTTTPDMASAGYAAIQTEMQAKGCLLANACHGKPAVTGQNMVIDVTAGQQMANWTLLLQGTPVAAGKFVNTASPAASLILTKPLNADASHTGGTIFASTADPDYVAWLAWITAGAPFN